MFGSETDLIELGLEVIGVWAFGPFGKIIIIKIIIIIITSNTSNLIKIPND